MSTEAGAPFRPAIDTTRTEPSSLMGHIPLLGFSGSDSPSDDIINTCVHCGLCLSACPTYRETGVEMSSPRGRIHLMKAVSEGQIGMNSEVFQGQMSECLNCRACEAVCPSGVHYGAILEASRAQLERARLQALQPGSNAERAGLERRPLWQRIIRKGVFDGLFHSMTWFRAFSGAMAAYQRTGVQWVARRSGLLRMFGLDEMESMLPTLSRSFVVPQGQMYRAEGEPRATVALLTGCIMSTAFAEVHEATIRVLQKNHCEVLLPPGQECCGALHSHGGDLEGARNLARRNIAAFEGLGVDAIIINAAGCGSTLKEYAELLHDDPRWRRRAEAFVAKIQDVHEFLAGIGLERSGLGMLSVRVTYQEPCHLAHAQRISIQPRALLRAIPGLELREMQESALCCGSAGVYNITQPEMAARLGARKIQHALATGAEVIATGNPGCAVQMAGELYRRGKPVQVRYIVELLDEAYRRGS
jgi:glycolate oxidase iron-sulfur subunit